LTIALQPDWRGALRAAGLTARAGSYQGETQNFETPGAFFGRLTALRWASVHTLQGLGELARRVRRDVNRVHVDLVMEPQPLAAA